jgi:beta-lactamase class D
MTLVNWLPFSKETQSTSQAMYNKVSSDISFCDEKLVVSSNAFKMHHNAFGWFVGLVTQRNMYFMLHWILFAL